MAKFILILTALCTAIAILSGCNLLDKANGIILYGEEEDVLKALREEHEGQIEKESFPIKMLETDGEQMMIMDKESAQFLIDWKLLRKVVSGDDTQAVESLPELAEGEGLLFAKNEKSEKLVEALNVIANYEGNIIIGNGRAYADLFLVVDKDTFTEIEVPIKKIGIIQYDKDPDGIGAFAVEREQLVKIEK